MSDLVKGESNISVVGLKIKYPQGAEKQLIYCRQPEEKSLTKAALPMDCGVVVDNTGTAAAVYDAVRYKKPCIQRVITVTGSIVKEPKNLLARVGTPFSNLLEFCGGTTEDIGKIISGGPMMGFAISSLEPPVAKTSSGLLFFDKKMARKSEEHTCLRCGSCVDICPLNLVPSMIASAGKV